ncbi:MAG TPA: hypothetical protein VF426_11595 [Marmoricola sp.]
MTDQTPPPGDQPPTAPPPAFPPPADGGQPSGSGPYSAPEAISYGWARFSKSPATLLVPVLIVLVVMIVLEVIVQLVLRASLLGTHDCGTTTVFGQTVTQTCGPSFIATLFGAAIAGFVVSLIAQVLGAGLIKCGLDVADGKQPSAGEVFAYVSHSNVIVAGLLVSVATFIGTLLCYVPGLIVGFLLMFTMFFVVDKNLAPMDAVKASVHFTTSHLGETVLFYVLSAVCLIIGAILCGIGLLAAIPVVLVGAAYTFRRLHDEPVAPAA